MQMILKSLAYRRGRSLLLLAVLTMAASLVTALGIVSSSMGARVSEEVKKYGANLIIDQATASIEVGSGVLGFGLFAEPARLPRPEIQKAVISEGIDACSFHLRGVLRVSGSDIPAEGVDFRSVRALYPWWQIHGSWPDSGGAVVGIDLAAQLKASAGDLLRVSGVASEELIRISAIVVTGGEEDKLLFLPLERMQSLLNSGDTVSQARLLARPGQVTLQQRSASLQRMLPLARVREIRQVARTSENLLKKVQLLMTLVTGVVLIASASSVASTMSMTVLERGKEIGLLKAMGGSRRAVLFIFSGEAAMLGIMGGTAGFFFGTFIAAFVMHTVFDVSSGFVPIYAIISLLASLLIALLGSTGAMAAVFRLDPVRSLRGE